MEKPDIVKEYQQQVRFVDKLEAAYNKGIANKKQLEAARKKEERLKESVKTL